MNDGFTIKRNKCGTEIIIKNSEEAVKIISAIWDYGDAEAELNCSNKECDNKIERIR